MWVIYRISDELSTHPSPIQLASKHERNICSLTMFVEAFKKINPFCYFLFDSVLNDYTTSFSKIVPFKYEIEFSNKGNVGSYYRALEIAYECGQTVLLQEDDYAYKSDTGKKMLEAIDELGFITGYDHPHWYPYESNIKLINNTHWRTVPSTTLTFAARNDLLKKHYNTFHGYQINDHQMWTKITQEDKLWSPIPGLTTHLVKGLLSPGFTL